MLLYGFEIQFSQVKYCVKDINKVLNVYGIKTPDGGNLAGEENRITKARIGTYGSGTNSYL